MWASPPMASPTEVKMATFIAEALGYEGYFKINMPWMANTSRPGLVVDIRPVPRGSISRR